MNKEIKEVNNYFRDKITAGDFRTDEISEHTIAITVDKRYRFILWTASGEESFETYSGSFFVPNYMKIDFRAADKQKAWKIFEAIKKDHFDNVLRVKKLAEFEALKIELNINCNEKTK
jgi:hypothetical protein